MLLFGVCFVLLTSGGFTRGGAGVCCTPSGKSTIYKSTKFGTGSTTALNLFKLGNHVY